MFILISHSFAEKHTSKLNKICPHTDDIDLPRCMKLMNSDSPTAPADTRGLIEVAIDLARLETFLRILIHIMLSGRAARGLIDSPHVTKIIAMP